jgi:glutamate-ammonia-ligase adenylyltransferase
VLDLWSPALERDLASAPDPALARVSLARVAEHAEARAAFARPEALAAAVRLLGFSTAAADLLVAHPQEASALADVAARSRVELDAELADDIRGLGLPDGLRRFRRRSMLRVGGPGPVVGAVRGDRGRDHRGGGGVSRRGGPLGRPEGLAVVALGKLGGAELNYASDVDVVFVHEGSGPERQEAAERASAALVRSLAEPTAEGIAFRVDTTLRPGGARGALSWSLEAMRGYYATQAAAWERQALIKARPVAGEPDLGTAFVEAVAPFVFPEVLPESTIDEVRRVKVRLEEYVRASGKAGVEVKRGRGGIRDVEFAVQLLQIVHGRRDERLRVPNTLRALEILADEGYVARDDAVALGRAYRFLRTLEHRLQIVRDLQTHELPRTPPPEPSSRARSARAARTSCSPSSSGRPRWSGRSTSASSTGPLLESFAGPSTPRPGRDREATVELLGALGFDEPSAAYEVLARLVEPSTHLGKVLGHVFPVMVPALALASEPDAALVRLERVIAATAGEGRLADALANDTRMACGLPTWWRRARSRPICSRVVPSACSRCRREPRPTTGRRPSCRRRRGTRRGSSSPTRPERSSRRSRTGSSPTRSRPPNPTCRSR